jgi:hypothetical protein
LLLPNKASHESHGRHEQNRDRFEKRDFELQTFLWSPEAVSDVTKILKEVQSLNGQVETFFGCKKKIKFHFTFTMTTAALQRTLLLLVFSFLLVPATVVEGFISRLKPSWASRLPPLSMSKKLKNKQAEMLEKLKKAKQQKDGGGDSRNDDADDADGSASRLSKEEIKEQNDRMRFQELLDKSSSMILNDYSSDGYLNKRQEEEEISAQMSGVERIFEGDPAPIRCFEGLVTIQTETPIGKRGAERLIPWFSANNADKSNYLICISDPRPTSHELKETVKSLMTELPLDIRSRIIVINADSPAENRRWLKRNPMLEEQNLQVYSDEKKEWMQAYTALDKMRWSMTMFLIADERVQALARDLDMYAASRVVQNAVKKLKEARL